jgi:hypothetical protein
MWHSCCCRCGRRRGLQLLLLLLWVAGVGGCALPLGGWWCQQHCTFIV